ncbi:serine hydrolase [Lentzea sp. NPDC059081]|uniref:serine hydrolase n=1 Tax=Lentzea sp. NPDC059081 TaxID=3346719 RepID=UPI0036755273
MSRGITVRHPPAARASGLDADHVTRQRAIAGFAVPRRRLRSRLGTAFLLPHRLNGTRQADGNVAGHHPRSSSRRIPGTHERRSGRRSHDEVGGLLLHRPGGSYLAMSARDLMPFVRLHLRDHATLREPQLASVPDFGGGVRNWGLGWMLYATGAGHTGVSKGQKAYLRLDRERAVVVLTNSANADALAHEIFSATLSGIDPLPAPPTRRRPIDDWMCGTYRTNFQDTTLAVEGGRAFLTHRPHNGSAERRVEVTRLGDDTIITTEPPYQVLSLIRSGNTAKFLHNGAAAGRIA